MSDIRIQYEIYQAIGQQVTTVCPTDIEPIHTEITRSDIDE